MGMVRKSFTLTEKQDAWLKEQMASGHYGNESEIIRDLIRERTAEYQPKETPEEIEVIRREIIKGLESGPPIRTTGEEMLAEFKARLQREKKL